MNTDTIATMTTKQIARKVADATGITYQEARAIVRDHMIDLDIERVDYNKNLHAWEVEYRTGKALVAHIVTAHPVDCIAN